MGPACWGCRVGNGNVELLPVCCPRGGAGPEAPPSQLPLNRAARGPCLSGVSPGTHATQRCPPTSRPPGALQAGHTPRLHCLPLSSPQPSCTSAHTSSESSAIPAQPPPAAALPSPATRGGWHPGSKVAREDPQEGAELPQGEGLLLGFTAQAPAWYCLISPFPR